ncbi:ribosome biogenesis GTPase YlqF [uncultured Tyzzerella sp.]|uniref:ribosome biogenesis GTPase YlqF n=1 Tax=uncultured Tyzzerella sp. TaxID=2321398 RepID=UPI0029434345|nr:ribosome biogenesis GTPase YlqF [uncultured Tyzzerella sp.]
MNIQWYPGHMTKTRRMMQENISLVDIVIELLDARIPYSSKNPEIDELAKNKHRIVILNKVDLADDKKTNLWIKYFEERNCKVILVNSITGKGLKDITEVAKELMKEKVERLKQRGRLFVPTRAMIVGIPNVGKSTLINKFVGKSLAKTGDKPGVTRGKQWIKIKKDFELLDTPGILWPKFEDQKVGLKLAFTGAVNDDILDTYTLALNLIDYLRQIYPNSLKERYKIDFNDEDKSEKILENIGIARSFKTKGGEIDLQRAAYILIDEFRGCRLGKITLEEPYDFLDNDLNV